MTACSTPDIQEVYLGQAEVRETFSVPKVGMVAGCGVVDGKLTRSAKVRLLRDGVVIYTGSLGSLQRFKDDAKEVQGLRVRRRPGELQRHQGRRRHRGLRDQGSRRLPDVRPEDQPRGIRPGVGPHAASPPENRWSSPSPFSISTSPPAEAEEKRAFLRPLKARLRTGFEIACPGRPPDLLQRAAVGVVAVGPDRSALEPLLSRVVEYVEGWAEESGVELTSLRLQFLGQATSAPP